MNVKAYKNYEIELRTSDNLAEKYIISGNSNEVKHELKELLCMLHFNNTDYKEVISLFEIIVQKHKIVSIDDLNSSKLATGATNKACILVKINLVRADDNIDIHRTNKHGEYIEIKRQKQCEVVEIITKKRVEKAIGNILTNINKLKNSSIERNILFDKLNNSEVEITSTGAGCFDENVIAIDDDILIELDNFVIHGKLECTEESSYSARVVLHIEYYSVLFKENHKKFITFDDLSRIFCNVKSYMYSCDIEILEKLDNDLTEKLNSI